MPETFGARLRQQRERQKIDLRSIAEQTKINLGLLEGLERDDISHWPNGIFRRAFIRSYAEHIGLDPVVVASEFLQLNPDPVEVHPDVADTPADAPPSTRVRYLIRSALDTIAAGRRNAAEPTITATETTSERAASQVSDPSAAVLPQGTEPDLVEAADLCTELGCLPEPHQAVTVLKRMAKVLDAVGVIIWIWDRPSSELRPWLANGYSDQVLAHLPRVRRDAKNATAAAFRSMETCVVAGTDLLSGAVVVPLLTSLGCVGVLAVELPNGREQVSSVRALATIFAAQLALLVGMIPHSEAVTA